MMRHLPVSRRWALLLAIGVSLFGVAGTTLGHAELETATPADGSTVEGTPPEISGLYSEPMTPDGSSLKLVDASGAEIATGGVVPGDDTKMAIDPVPELAAGTYTVESTTTSAADGDIDRKKWSFTVAAAVPSETPAPTPSPTAAPTASAPPASASVAPSVAPSSAPATTAPTPAASPAASADDGSTTGSGTDALLPILAAVVIVVVIGGVLYSRRDRSTPTTPS